LNLKQNKIKSPVIYK